MIEGVEHAQRSDRAVRVGAPALPALPLEPLLEQILERLLEALDPLGALGAKIHDLDIGDELVLLEQVVGALDRCRHDLDQARQELRAAFAQQCPRFVAREQQFAVGVGGRRRGRRRNRIGHGDSKVAKASPPGTRVEAGRMSGRYGGIQWGRREGERDRGRWATARARHRPGVTVERRSGDNRTLQTVSHCGRRTAGRLNHAFLKHRARQDSGPIPREEPSMKCIACGNENQPGAKFCVHCGVVLGAAPAPPVRCPAGAAPAGSRAAPAPRPPPRRSPRRAARRPPPRARPAPRRHRPWPWTRRRLLPPAAAARRHRHSSRGGTDRRRHRDLDRARRGRLFRLSLARRRRQGNGRGGRSAQTRAKRPRRPPARDHDDGARSRTAAPGGMSTAPPSEAHAAPAMPAEAAERSGGDQRATAAESPPTAAAATKSGPAQAKAPRPKAPKAAAAARQRKKRPRSRAPRGRRARRGKAPAAGGTGAGSLADVRRRDWRNARNWTSSRASAASKSSVGTTARATGDGSAMPGRVPGAPDSRRVPRRARRGANPACASAPPVPRRQSNRQCEQYRARLRGWPHRMCGEPKGGTCLASFQRPELMSSPVAARANRRSARHDGRMVRNGCSSAVIMLYLTGGWEADPISIPEENGWMKCRICASECPPGAKLCRDCAAARKRAFAATVTQPLLAAAGAPSVGRPRFAPRPPSCARTASASAMRPATARSEAVMAASAAEARAARPRHARRAVAVACAGHRHRGRIPADTRSFRAARPAKRRDGRPSEARATRLPPAAPAQQRARRLTRSHRSRRGPPKRQATPRRGGGAADTELKQPKQRTARRRPRSSPRARPRPAAASPQPRQPVPAPRAPAPPRCSRRRGIPGRR